MEIKISARHGNLSEKTQEKVIAKVEKLTRIYERLAAIEVTVDLEHRDNPRVELKASGEHKHDFMATSQASELMAALDVVVQKVEQQLRKHKEKVRDRHRDGSQRRQEKATDTKQARD